ncbi:transcription initiation protein SPT3 homolog [Euwallacea similis]|uniref:transcription initiation protein SPT3 homolog n=1 Tax=Euwallacea similis TaxID=1736056 RepID=UPI00344D3BC1
MPNKMQNHHHQIHMMMYGLGDSHDPNPDTVQLVESIVQSQLKTIVIEALKYGDGKVLRGRDLVFLLRHNKYKMHRFIRYILHKELSQKLKCSSTVSKIDHDDKTKNKLIKFIESIDETGEFLDMSEVDETKVERMLRADRISRNLSEEKYLEFQKSRCASFKTCPRSFENIKQWIDPKKELIFEDDSMDVLCYLAFQTVAELVDYALLVREDAQSGSDPLAHLPGSGSYYTAAMFKAPHGLERGRVDCARIRTNQAPISVGEIKEVMRRIYSPQTGKLNFGGKVPDTHYLLAL